MAGAELQLRVAWDRHLGTGPAARRWFESVVDRYREPHRHYHDVRHVTWVVRHVEDLAAGDAVIVAGIDLDVTIAAAFFHDAVYVATSEDNEEVSGRLAASALTDLGWDRARVDHVDRLIRGTATHVVEDATAEAAVLFAADLAVLAAEPAAYSDYARNVRREYSHVDDGAWRVGRASVLRAFLGRPAIYAPALGLDTWERRARANLTAELEALAVGDQ